MLESSRVGVLVRGARLHLRDLEVSDVGAGYETWMNDPAVTRFLESRFRSWTRDDLIAFIDADKRARSACSFAVCMNDSLRHIGNIRIGKYDPPHLNGSVGLLIGDAASRGKGYGTEAIELVCAIAFEKLGLHRLTAGCYATNFASIAAFKKAGFCQEGLQRERWVDGEHRVDGLMLGFTRGDWLAKQAMSR
jgi:[ribosomal protein S5]-alanine N-acetyltransferase